MKHVVVVGGGLSGLSTAFLLHRAGYAVTVLEASGQWGGNIQHFSSSTHPVEMGPNSLLDNRPKTREFLDEMSLGDEELEAAPSASRRFVYVGGQMREARPSPLALFRLLGLWGFLRLLTEPFRGLQKAVHTLSISEFFDHRIGKKARTVLVDAFVGGIYGGDTSKLGMQACFPRLVAAVEKHGSLFRALRAMGGSARARTLTFRGGLQTWIQRMVHSLDPSRLHLNTQAILVQPSASEKTYQVVFQQDGQETSVDCDNVVVCTNARQAATLLRNLLPDSSTAALASIPYIPMITVGTLSEGGLPARSSTEAFGFLSPPSGGLSILGSVYPTTVFPSLFSGEGHVSTVFLGGARTPEAIDWTDERIEETVCDDLERSVGIRPTSILFIKRWREAIPQLVVGHEKNIERIQQGLGAVPGIYLNGNYITGVSLHDCVAGAYKCFEAIETSDARFPHTG